MAPEQFVPDGRLLDRPIDVYALGVVLYELLTGRPPIEAPHDQSTPVRLPHPLDPAAIQPWPTRPGRPQVGLRTRVAWLDQICYHCLRKRPDHRLSAEQVALDLRQVAAGQPPNYATRVTRAHRAEDEEEFNPGLQNTRRWWRRVKRVGVVSATCFIGIIGTLAWNNAEIRLARDKAKDAQQQTATANVKLSQANGQIAELNTKLVTERGTIDLARSDPAAAIFHLIHSLALAPPDAAAQRHYLRTAIATASDSLHRLEDIVSAGGQIRATAASPDGSQVAMADETGTLRVRDTRTATLRETPLGREKGDSLAAIAYTQDGRSIVTVNNDGKVFLVNAHTLQSRALCKFPGMPLALAVRAGGKTLAIGGTETEKPGTVSLMVFDLETERLAAPSFAIPGRVDAIAFSPDGRLLATSGHRENCLRVWSVDDGREPFDAPIPHPGPIFALAFSPDGGQLASGCIDGGIRFWDARTGRPTAPSLRHSHPVRALAYHREESTGELLLLSGAEDGTARVWSVDLGAPVGQPLHHLSDVRGVAFCPGGDNLRFVTTGFDGTARVWRMRPGKSVTTLRHSAGVAAIAFSPDGRTILTGCRDAAIEKGTVSIWTQDQPFGRWARRRTFEQLGEALAVGYARDGGEEVILGAGNDGHARLWHADGRLKLPPQPHGDEKNIIHSAAITPDGRYVAFAGRSRMIRLLDCKTGTVSAWEGPETSWVWSVTFSADGRRLLTDGRSGALLWPVPPPAGGPVPSLGKPMLLKAGEPTPHEVEVRWSTLSADGRRVLGCGGGGGAAGVWDAETGRPVLVTAGHQGRVYAGAFHPTNQDLLATAGADHTVRIWDVRRSAPEVKSLVHESKVRAVAFSSDGSQIVTGCDDGTARIWSVDSGAWQGSVLYHQGPVTRVVYRPGHTGPAQILTASNDGTARLWTIPSPIDDDGRLRLRFMVDTGMEPVERDSNNTVDPLRSDEGLLRVLNTREWRQERKNLLNAPLLAP